MDANLTAAGEPSARHEVRLKSTATGFDLFGWFVLFVLAYLPLAIPQAWWQRGFLRWMTRNVSIADGSVFAFAGDPKAIWYFFPLMWLLEVPRGSMHNVGLATSMNIVGMAFGYWVSWRVFRWFSDGVTLRETIRFRLTAPALQYMGWMLLITLSYLTIVVWPWVVLAFFRWILRHMESEHAELHMVGKPLGLLGIGLVAYGLPAASILVAAQLSCGETAKLFVSIFSGLLRPDMSFLHGWIIALVAFWVIVTPWLLAWLMRWVIGNTVLMVSDSAPGVVENRTASA